MNPFEMFAFTLAGLAAVGVGITPMLALLFWMTGWNMPEPLHSIVGVGVGLVYTAAFVSCAVWALDKVAWL